MELARQHVLYDVWLEDTTRLERVAPWRDLLTNIAHQAGLTIIKAHFHQFTPVGVTGFLLLAESHISVHTWPEEGFAAIDIFTCGAMDAEAIVARLRQALQPRRERLSSHLRA